MVEPTTNTDTADDSTGGGRGPGLLAGLKVVEFTQVVAGPLAAAFLSDLGADVVHVEPPRAGDPARVMGPKKGDTYLWWKVAGRNKRSVTLDLRTAEGQKVAKRMVRWADVVLVSLRQPTLIEWGLDWQSLHAENPRLVVLQISGYGANGSMAGAPGFGKMGEARSGIVNLTGPADGPPMHVGFSHGDTVTGLMGAYAILAALYRRSNDPDFDGEWIDVALFEPLFRLNEWQVIVHDQLGMIPGRMGNKMAIAPAAVVNTYQSRDSDWITVTSATLKSVISIVRLIGLDESRFQTADDQNANGAEIDRVLAGWIAQHSTEEALAKLTEANVVASRIFTIADIMQDPIYAEREDIITVADPDLGPIKMQAVIPRFENHPGTVWRSGPALGQDNDMVYTDWMGLSESEIAELRESGTI